MHLHFELKCSKSICIYFIFWYNYRRVGGEYEEDSFCPIASSSYWVY